ncbi:sulfate transporter CysZ [Caldichromatium japonicum]|uniref:Sulfate transporter CysZ n=1 Tax=Caldichromatium japonicum TaxID=2699430 RepID=A0A6G7VBU7_9GAMM|nr:sulfate transporter CysZ [Caldichromatium japonicum]QIK37491.1 sulfate transporter CysZ [Caldichromatium japonicum]
MLSRFFTGAGYLIQGLRLLVRPGIKRFVLIPLGVNILVFAAAIALAIQQFRHWLGWLESSLPTWLNWLDWLLWPFIILALALVVFFTFGLVANLLAAPFNGLLAEKVERLLTGRFIVQEGDQGRFWAELIPSLVDELRKLVYALFWTLPFLALLSVPVVGAILWFGYTAWMLAVEYNDYPMGNHGLRFKEIRQRLRQHLGLSLGFGGAAAAMSMIPGLNLLLMPAAVAGATLMWVREFRPAADYPGPHQSRVATRAVLLLVDHLSGRMSGKILSGPFAGQSLETIETQALIDLLMGYLRRDPESAEALEVYLAHERGQPLIESVRRRPVEEEPPPTPPGLDEREAYAILGLDEGADRAAIESAHRRLIQRLHPDRGGSAYLAARVNEARRLLMAQRAADRRDAV